MLWEKVAITDDYCHLFHVAFFTSGHPYGPLWASMDPYIISYIFMVVIWVLSCLYIFLVVYMFYLVVLVLHLFLSPSCNFPRIMLRVLRPKNSAYYESYVFFFNTWNILFVYLIDFRLLVPQPRVVCLLSSHPWAPSWSWQDLTFPDPPVPPRPGLLLLLLFFYPLTQNRQFHKTT